MHIFISIENIEDLEKCHHCQELIATINFGAIKSIS